MRPWVSVVAVVGHLESEHHLRALMNEYEVGSRYSSHRRINYHFRHLRRLGRIRQAFDPLEWARPRRGLRFPG
jgi:hypothetical protein